MMSRLPDVLLKTSYAACNNDNEILSARYLEKLFEIPWNLMRLYSMMRKLPDRLGMTLTVLTGP